MKIVYYEKLKKWYERSNKLTTKVVSKMGARGHINPLFKIKKVNDYCTCDCFEYIERKQIKRCNININNLEKRLINAINSSADNTLGEINFASKDNCLFIGTGGSYASAYFASRVINSLYGCNTYALYPRDVLYRNNANINKVILFSYSGTTNDIINSVKDFDSKNIYLITKGELKTIVLKTGILKKSMGNIDAIEFIKDSINYWDEQIAKIIVNNVVKIKENKLINIFRGDYVNTASYDLESKIIESGIFNCIIHEKKNFSHGRFINYDASTGIY